MKSRLCFLIPSAHQLSCVQRVSLAMKRKATNDSTRKQPAKIPPSSIGAYLSVLPKQDYSSSANTAQTNENKTQVSNCTQSEAHSESSCSASDHSVQLAEETNLQENIDECTFSSVTWKPPARTPFRFLADAFEVMEATTSRLSLIKILTQVFHKIVNTTPDDLLPCVYLCTNTLGPAHEVG